MTLYAALMAIFGIGITWVGMLLVGGQLAPTKLAAFYQALPNPTLRLFLSMLTFQFGGVWLIIRALALHPVGAGLGSIAAGAIIPVIAALYLTGKAPTFQMALILIVIFLGLLWLNHAINQAPLSS